MSILKWGELETERTFEVGVKHGVLYRGAITAAHAYAWNGLTSVSESPEGAEETALYADDMKYLSLLSAEEFGATIEAYTYPDEFNPCIGIAENTYGFYGQQAREKFCFCYRTQMGNAAKQDAGFIIHVVYNCYASASDRGYETINDSPDAITFSWEISTTKQEFSYNSASYSASAIEFRVYGLDETNQKTDSDEGGTHTDDGLTYAEWVALSARLYEKTSAVNISPDSLLTLIANVSN